MGAGHDHGQGKMSDNRLFWAVAINILLTVAQVVGGIVSGSLSLIADALHNLSDAGSLLLALIARRISRRPADEEKTFGYNRAEIIGALINLTTLVLIGLYLIYEAVMRYFEPQEISGWIVVIVASIALIIDIGTAILTYALSKRSINVKAAFLHNVSDALASVGVIIVGTLIILYDLYIVDSIVTLIIAGYVLYQGFSSLPRAINILMQAVPPDIDRSEVIASMQKVRGVRGIHHVHIWEIDEHRRSLEAHVVVIKTDLNAMETIKRDIKDLLKDKFGISHSTLEFELEESSFHLGDKTAQHYIDPK
jgi:cobalt-zinc-cadmium efflux system protein